MFTKLHDLYTWNFQKEVTNLTPRSGWILLQCVHFGLAVYFIGGKGGEGGLRHGQRLYGNRANRAPTFEVPHS